MRYLTFRILQPTSSKVTAITITKNINLQVKHPPYYWNVRHACKIEETLLISDLKPSLNESLGSEKLSLYKYLLYGGECFTGN